MDSSKERIKFHPRDYQQNLLDAFDKYGYKKILSIWPRRAGKTLTAWNLCLRELMRKPQTIYYVFPSHSMGERSLWTAKTNEGISFLDYVPWSCVESLSRKFMRIEFCNGSIFQIIGERNYDFEEKLIPDGIVISEPALHDPKIYSAIEESVTSNDGWILLEGTPYEKKNHFYDIYKNSASGPGQWFISKLTVDDTKHITIEEILQERACGQLSEKFQRRDYWTEFLDEEGQK